MYNTDDPTLCATASEGNGGSIKKPSFLQVFTVISLILLFAAAIAEIGVASVFYEEAAEEEFHLYVFIVEAFIMAGAIALLLPRFTSSDKWVYTLIPEAVLCGIFCINVLIHILLNQNIKMYWLLPVIGAGACIALTVLIILSFARNVAAGVDFIARKKGDRRLAAKQGEQCPSSD